MPRKRTKTDKRLMVAGAAGFAASRIIPIPTPILILVGIFLGGVILWLGGRAIIRRRKEKRQDQHTAWTTFVRDRDVS